MSEFEQLAKSYMEEKYPGGDPTASNDPMARVFITLEKEQDLETRASEATTPKEVEVEGAAPDAPSLSERSTEEGDFPSPEIDRSTEVADSPAEFKLETDSVQNDEDVRGPDISDGSDGARDKPPSQLIYTPEGLQFNNQEFEQPDVRLETSEDIETDYNPGIQDTTIVPKGNEDFARMLDDVDKRVVVPEYISPSDIPLPDLPPVPDLSILIPNAADHQMAAQGVNLMNWERQ